MNIFRTRKSNGLTDRLYSAGNNLRDITEDTVNTL